MKNENSTIFVAYAPKEVRLYPCESTVVNMQLKMKLPHQIKGLILLLPRYQTSH